MASRAHGPVAAWLLAILTVTVIVVALRDSFLGMLFQWQSSSTFSYGVLILPVSLFLLWRERLRLARVGPEPGWLALALMLPAGAIWVLGTVLEVNVVHHFAAVLLVILAVWAVLGTPTARVIWFPLGYLLLMVPFGEFLVPTLMQWTADFAVLAVTLTGVPVFQDGYVFSLPSGDFEVIKACSGIRFLMATVAAGVVFTWVAYRSWRKRLLFLLACLVVPVVGNLVRAYLVVMLVHLSEGRLAGDHVYYGTIFFAAVLLVLFLIGARYADPPAAGPDPGVTVVAAGTGAYQVLAMAAIAVVLAILVASSPAGLRQRMAQDAWALLPPMPNPVAGYRGPTDGVANWQPAFQGAASERAARYRAVATTLPVDAFMAAYDPALRTGELTDSRNLLFDDEVWRRVAGSSRQGYTETVLRPAPGAALPDGTARLVWSWYAVNGRTTDSRLGAKFLELQGLLGGGERQQVVVALSAPYDGDATLARQELRAFAAMFCSGSGPPCPAALGGKR